MENCGNFREMVIITDTEKVDILWWQSSILESYAATRKKIRSITLDTDASSYRWSNVNRKYKNWGSY